MKTIHLLNTLLQVMSRNVTYNYTKLLQFQRENDDSGALFIVLHSAEIQPFWGSYTLLLVIVALRFQRGRYNLFQGLTDET